VKEQSIWKRLHNRFSFHFNSIVTRAAVVVLDGFTSGQSSEAIENAILVFDLKSEVVERLSVLLDVTTSLANHN
jgi:hypothetical protein